MPRQSQKRITVKVGRNLNPVSDCPGSASSRLERRSADARELELKRFEDRQKLTNRGNPPPALAWKLLVWDMLVVPCHLVGDVHGLAAKGDHRHDIRAQRVAHHDEFFRRYPAASEDRLVRVDALLADDLDPEKQVAQT